MLRASLLLLLLTPVSTTAVVLAPNEEETAPKKIRNIDGLKNPELLPQDRLWEEAFGTLVDFAYDRTTLLLPNAWTRLLAATFTSQLRM